MTDTPYIEALVVRLRGAVSCHDSVGFHKKMMDEAANALERTQAVMKTSARYINELCNPPSHYDPDDYDEEGRSPMTFLRLDYENALAALDAPPEGEG